jgi:hypothetical protein
VSRIPSATRRWSERDLNSRSHTPRCRFECRPELTRSCGSAQNPAQVKDSGKVPKTHSVGSVGDHNLGVFTITEIALKIANAVPPTHLISGAPNAAYVDL